MKPEDDLRISIQGLKVYGMEPNIIKSMLDNLDKILNKEKPKSPIIHSDCNCELFEWYKKVKNIPF
jgi:UDP-N-acetylglucosamine 2-epimerase